jgi:osmotically-inducible protein OsmY
MAHQFIEAPVHELSNSEEALFHEVRRVLWDYEPLRSTRAPIAIEVRGGEVTLLGRTRTEALRLLGGYLVSFVPGVTEVKNQVVSDDQVIRAVADVLAADQLTAPHVVQVNARHGEVTLRGQVSSLEAEARAVELARAVPLVSGVQSDLAVVQAAALPSSPPRAEIR